MLSNSAGIPLMSTPYVDMTPSLVRAVTEAVSKYNKAQNEEVKRVRSLEDVLNKNAMPANGPTMVPIRSALQGMNVTYSKSPWG
jgi:hypothetical protein